ncbi:hypothetical protein TNCV_4232211 [Trichonephila clavipes]|nr:hypothetical protein TNCV_4232211 [Trichonephila clavipes]
MTGRKCYGMQIISFSVHSDNKYLHKQFETFVVVWTLSLETMTETNINTASQTGASLMHQDGRIRIWLHRGECTLAACIRHTDPLPGANVCGVTGYLSLSPLVSIDDTLTCGSALYSSTEKPYVSAG